MQYKIALTLYLVIAVIHISAKEITGYVKAAGNQEPVPFTNVIIKGTTKGTMADINGYFKIAVSDGDTLYFSAVGYYSRELPVSQIDEQQLIVELSEKMQLVGEVTVRPEVPRAVQLLKLIQEHKKENQGKIERVKDYKTYTNTTAYLAIDTSSLIGGAIKDAQETTFPTDNDNFRFSPVYLEEEATRYSPEKDTTLFTKEDGIFPNLNKAIKSLILINMEVDLDFYRDQVYILERGFISPISNSAQSYYHIYLNDSMVVNDTKYFRFSFVPKNKYNPLFSGHFVVEDSTFALTQINTYIAQEANYNFVNGFESNISYTKHADGKWFYEEQKIKLNLSLVLNKDSVNRYSSQRVDNVKGGNWLITRSITYSTSLRLDQIEPAIWGRQPEFVEHAIDEDIYEMVNRIKEQNMIKAFDAAGGAALTSFFNIGLLDLGPIFDIYYTNLIEGNRFSLPLRTSEKFSKRFSVGGYLGYGTKNQEFKYGYNFAVQPFQTDVVLLRFNYYNDYILVTQDKFLRYVKKNPNNRGNGNFVAIFTSWERNPYLKEEEYYEAKIEYNTPGEMHFEFVPYYLRNTSTPNVRFIREGIGYPKYSNYGLFLHMKYGFRQHFDKFFFDRIYYMTPTPVVNFSWDIGKVSLPGNTGFNPGYYSHLHGSIQGRQNLGLIFMDYMVNAGYLFGDAPYDLLDQPVGSMSLGYSAYRFNLLHHASFAHNLYSNAHVYFNGGGIFLNKVPGVKKLKLREILSFKMHVGTLTDGYKGVFDLPGYYSNPSSVPYAEIGIGVTNIFKVGRVEYVHLVGNKYKNSGFTDVHGIRIKGEFSF
ncbi:DUF5686 and carboxypeptidase-like regulatory domain-containing protein [Maribellus sediminis]|uniref:DUF5686 and carboxypeptidase-like regulatory domain-containing protein n=1 Tax=Maribellus sediminis TaxID=2696285 RepID=UPI001431C6FE|nr:DUF5686 and carboxypeptidase-like regulatory domain-containing protein [Maribellus sediminis]